MNKLLRVMQIYIVLGFIACITLMLVGKLHNPSIDQFFLNWPTIFYSILGVGLGIWFVVLTIYLVALISMKTIRERSLKKIANIKDEDEREISITGNASKTAYLTGLSLMLFFLFFSVCSISVDRFIKPIKPNGPHYSMNISFDYNFMKNNERENDPSREAVFDTRQLFPSNSTILLILIAAQLLAYNISLRREKIM